MGTGIIYKAISPSGKCYIGQTVKTLEKRMAGHKSYSEMRDSPLCRAIKKYGFENFEWEILHKDVPKANLGLLEIWEIAKHGAYEKGYNCTTGGEINPMDFPENREKVSRRKKGKSQGKFSEEIRLRMSTSHGGKPFSVFKDGKLIGVWDTQMQCARDLELYQGNIGACLRGLRNCRFCKGYTLEYQDGSTPVIDRNETNRRKAIAKGAKLFNVYKDGKFISSWINQAECARNLSISHSNTNACLQKKRKTCSGYTFEYCEEEK